MAAPRPWTTLSSRTLLRRWWMTLREDRVRLPNGHVLDEFHVAEYPDWACVLALTDEGEAVLVEQYRYAIDRVRLELPAGVVDVGESLKDAARRELLEETGYEADALDFLGRLAVEPGRQTNYGNVFVASGARLAAAPDLDESEDMRVRLVPASSLPQLVEEGEIVHAVHAAAVFWAVHRGWVESAEPDRRRRVHPVPSPRTPPPMQKEQKTLLVSVNVEEHDNEDARMNQIGQEIGEGWKVIQAIPLSGEEAGPGGLSEDFMRYQVTVEREIDSDNVVIGADRGGAAGLKDAGQASGAFDDGIPEEDES